MSSGISEGMASSMISGLKEDSKSREAYRWTNCWNKTWPAALVSSREGWVIPPSIGTWWAREDKKSEFPRVEPVEHELSSFREEELLFKSFSRSSRFTWFLEADDSLTVTFLDSSGNGTTLASVSWGNGCPFDGTGFCAKGGGAKSAGWTMMMSSAAVLSSYVE